ncbi:MAG: hypothetical protein LBP81_06675 [Treponema sp.]|jgi:hypothetical protein|nr:hypothetical protein [Treponema sp.]
MKKVICVSAAILALVLNGCTSFWDRINKNAEILADEKPPEYAVFSPDIAAHIQRDLETLISLSNVHPEFNGWSLAYAQTGFGAIQSAVGQIRFNQYFSMPLYEGFSSNVNVKGTEDVTDAEETYSRADILLGSGLVFRHSIGTIGLMTGLRSYMETYRSDFSNSDTEEVLDSRLGYFYFSFVPLINTGKFPVIGLLFNVYEGLIGSNEGKFGDNFSHKLVSRGIDLGAVSIESVDILYKKQPYNAAAKLEEYGVKINLDAGKMAGAAEIGYRRFYDVRLEEALYEDSPYGIFDWTIWKIAKGGIGLRGRFDKLNSPIPAIGISAQFSILSLWAEVEGLNEPDDNNSRRYSPYSFGVRLFL